MSSKIQKLKVFLSLPTALVLFLTSSIAFFVVVSNFSNWTTYDETTGYGYGYGYGYDCFTELNKYTEQYETYCKNRYATDYRYDYGY